MSVPVIIDTDPGIDDSLAILLALASPELNVVGITTVFGNNGVASTARNAAKICAIVGRSDIPIAAGAAQPLVRNYHGKGKDFHGEDGLGGTGLGESMALPAGRALDLLYHQAELYDGDLVLITLGPLTNLALAVRSSDSFVRRIRSVITMGGAACLSGNATPVAEANIYNDPEAASIVFSAEWPLTMIGLDVTEKTILSAETLRLITTTSTQSAAFLRAILPYYVRAHQLQELDGGIFTHDPSAVAYAIDPSIFSTQEVPIFVETKGEYTLGATIPDWQGKFGVKSTVKVAIEVAPQRVADLILTRVRTLP